jgi:hypothetical protein
MVYYDNTPWPFSKNKLMQVGDPTTQFLFIFLPLLNDWLTYSIKSFAVSNFRRSKHTYYCWVQSCTPNWWFTWFIEIDLHNYGMNTMTFCRQNEGNLLINMQ